jgi:hypothetical protein
MKKKRPYPADTLGLNADEMRHLGYQVVDMVVDRLQAKQSLPALKCRDFEFLETMLKNDLLATTSFR